MKRKESWNGMPKVSMPTLSRDHLGCGAICFTDGAGPIGPLHVYGKTGKKVLREMT